MRFRFSIRTLSIGDIGNPDFSQLSFPRFEKTVAEEQSSDFSWFMTRTQLRNHKFQVGELDDSETKSLVRISEETIL